MSLLEVHIIFISLTFVCWMDDQNIMNTKMRNQMSTENASDIIFKT